jgi:hypothetical protein
MDWVDQAGASPVSCRSWGSSPGVRAVAIAAMMALAGLIGFEVHSLWSEWRALQGDLERTRHTTVVGYVNINLNPSFAQRPPNWIHDEGEYTLLWSGWKPGVGHGWFRLGRGEIDPKRISGPMGRDVIQAIDSPLVEIGGGPRWERIPEDAPVVGLEIGGVPSAYPVLVLQKVEVVNDTIGPRSVLVALRPFEPLERSIDVYDPVLDRQRVTLGLSGYFQDGKPVLYDRATESFWLAEEDGLVAFAGHFKGSRLPRLGHLVPVTWDAWRTQHPHGRLIVGANRAPAPPPK